MKDYDNDPEFQAFLQQGKKESVAKPEPEAPVVAPTEELSLQKRREKMLGNGCCIILIGFFLGIIGLFLLPHCSSPESRAKFDRDIDIAVMTKELVKRNLKAPASADFPWGMEVEELSSGLLRYEGYVDAQNSFGAMLRMRFSAIYDMVNGRPKLVQFTMGDSTVGNVSDYLRSRK